MPNPAKNGLVAEYPMARKGVNLSKSFVDLDPEECLSSQNLTWSNGMVKRPGSSKYEATEVSAGNRITGLHRFYFGANKQLLASSGTVVKYSTGSGWNSLATGMTSDLDVTFETWLDRTYFTNGTDAPQKWDGTTLSTVSAAPANTIQFQRYQDRLIGLTTSGVITWSGSFDDTTWNLEADTGARLGGRGYGMIEHSSTDDKVGINSKVLIAGDDGMYLFAASDMRTPSTTGSYSLYRIFNIGCEAADTMTWTPAGTMFLANDRQVYLLPFNSTTPVPVGEKITSRRGDEVGVEDTPPGKINEASAIYHNNYYKLSVTIEGGTVNTYQWWLDINRLQRDDDAQWGPWYGPMKGQSIQTFTAFDGGGDAGELVGGEANGLTGSYVYTLSDASVYSDDGTAIQIFYKTFHHPLTQEKSVTKNISRVEATLLDVLGTTTFNLSDIDGVNVGPFSVGLSGSATYWDELYWDEFYWSSTTATRVVTDIDPVAHLRSASITVDHSSAIDTFELYELRAPVIEQSYLLE